MMESVIEWKDRLLKAIEEDTLPDAAWAELMQCALVASEEGQTPEIDAALELESDE